ncbi:MAG: rhodanese-like domain-containing protein [Bacteroidales bacterium]|nr:rhodanese-like domain-containing protein [Bacteroidales bacterium]
MKNILRTTFLVVIISCFIACGNASDNKNNDIILEPKEYMETLNADTSAFLLDVRRASEYAEGHIPGATLLDVTNEPEFLKGIENLDKDKTIYIYCRSGRRSRIAAKHLIDNGFNVVDLKGGYNAWEATYNN